MKRFVYLSIIFVQLLTLMPCGVNQAIPKIEPSISPTSLRRIDGETIQET